MAQSALFVIQMQYAMPAVLIAAGVNRRPLQYRFFSCASHKNQEAQQGD
jgi:hypothetical protein